MTGNIWKIGNVGEESEDIFVVSGSLAESAEDLAALLKRVQEQARKEYEPPEWATLPCPFELCVREGHCAEPEEPEPLRVMLVPTRWRWLAGWLMRLTLWAGRYEGAVE